MISFHASAVCRVRDGYTGRTLEGSALLCTLDGAPVRPLAKEGGYLVLLNLGAGPHRLVLRSQGYQEEWVEFQAGSGTRELEITMKPGTGYPFRGEVTRLELTVKEGGLPAPGRQLWLAAPAQWELKVAQTRAEAGALQLRLYCKGPQGAVPPGPYLILDGEKSEVVVLQSLEEDLGNLGAPLLWDHARSRALLPAQRYHTDMNGMLSAVFQRAATLAVYTQEKGLAATFPLENGENRRNVDLQAREAGTAE